MSLETYKRKRDFDITSEPPARVEKDHARPIFVIQEHHASRLHYDFRLEADGVLKSWAVTKEPTLDPAIRRLAVEVEDHPIAYAKFHGDIPAGEYGAGHVEIWDHGTYENITGDEDGRRSIAEGIDAGTIEFVLHGEKLNGAFALVLMKGRGDKNWLLIKKKDAEARPGSATDGAARPPKKSTKRTPPARAGRSTARASKPPRDMEFTHLDRVMFPEPGFTKGDLLNFYDRIADYLLPHLYNRPITLERLPEGLATEKSPHFWQKDTPDYYPDWIPRVELETERGEPVNYVLVNDRQTLLYLVNQGTVTFHPWLSRIDDLDHPDFVLFDLDPGATSFADAMRVAKALHAVLEGRKIVNRIKTSGKSGLHLLVGWDRPGGYDEARAWAMEIAEQVVEELPDLATVERSKAERHGHLYIDVMQNARGHHAVPPYVVRAVPAGTVSTPIEWRELTGKLTPGKFDMKTIFRRLARKDEDIFAALAHPPKRTKTSRAK